MEINILIADDDHIFLDLLADIIKKQGYIPIKAHNGQQALDCFYENDIDLCILDVMMPYYNGWEVLKEIRQTSDVSIIMLTALGEENNEVKGLINGANDYIAKPFSYPVLVARIESLLRTVKQSKSQILKAGKIILNLSTHEFKVENKAITLNNKEFQLLSLFIKNQNILFERDTLIEKIWGYDFDGDTRTVDTHIKMLRNKLGSYGDYIITIRGMGYKFKVTYE